MKIPLYLFPVVLLTLYTRQTLINHAHEIVNYVMQMGSCACALCTKHGFDESMDSFIAGVVENGHGY